MLKIARKVAAVILCLAVLPAQAQQAMTYRSQQIECTWLTSEIQRMAEEQSWAVEEPSAFYKVFSFLKPALDMVGGQDEKAFIASVPAQHPFSFTHKPADILEAMRFKGCSSEYSQAISSVRSGVIKENEVYRPRSRLSK